MLEGPTFISRETGLSEYFVFDLILNDLQATTANSQSTTKYNNIDGLFTDKT